MEDKPTIGPSPDATHRHQKLQDMVVKRLSRALGAPEKSGAVVAHWSIERPEPLAPVSVIVPPILAQPPTVWVFDPDDPADGIHSEVVKEPQDVERVADVVTRKIKRTPPPRSQPGSQ